MDSFELERKRLENISGEYTNPDPAREVDQKFIRLVADKCLPLIVGPKVLELGFGDDAWTRGIVERYGKSHIIDASRKLLQLAREKYGKDIITHESLFEEFEAEGAFSSVLASFILEHVQNPTMVMKRIHSWLEPGGQLMIIVPNAGSFHRRLAVKMGILKKMDELGETDKQMGHRRVYTPRLMEMQILEAGFTIRQSKGLFFKPLPNSQMVGYSKELLSASMDISGEFPKDYAAALFYDCRKREE